MFFSNQKSFEFVFIAMLSFQKLPHAVVSDAPDQRPTRLRYSQNP